MDIKVSSVGAQMVACQRPYPKSPYFPAYEAGSLSHGASPNRRHSKRCGAF